MSAKMTWKKGRNYSGLVRLAPTYTLSIAGRWLATVQKSGAGWFWYAQGKNTFPYLTDLKTAKAEAKAFIVSKIGGAT